MLNQPTSSPMMTRMLGFFSAGAGVVIFSCATAGAAVPTAAKPTARSAANAVIALVCLSCVRLGRSSVEGIWIVLMSTSCDVVPPPAKFRPAPCRNQDNVTSGKMCEGGVLQITETATWKQPVGFLSY